MEFSEAVTLLKGRLSNFQSTAADAVIKSEMNAKQFALEQSDFKPWFLFTEKATAQNTALEERLPVPDDFIEEWEEGALYWKKTSESVYTPLGKDDYDYLIKTYTAASGTPKGYELAGDYFLIVPVPLEIYDWRMRYYAHQATNIDDGDENKWLKHAGEWLIAETGLVIANNYLNNDRAAKGFDVMRREAKARIEKLDTSRREANRERIQGEGV